MATRLGGARRLLAIGLTIGLFTSACGGGGDGAPAADDGSDAAEDAVASADADATAAEPDDADPSAEPAESGGVLSLDELPVARVALPVIPAVTLPDLSELSATGQVVDAGLDRASVTGFDVVGATCDVDGELRYQGDDESFLSLETIETNTVGDGVDLVVSPDGSGSLRDRTGETELDITVAADGSGSFRDRSGLTEVDITVDAEGAGSYRDRSPDTEVDLTVNADGTGSFRDRSGLTELDVVIADDGSGSLRDRSANNEIEVDLTVSADGSGSFRDRSSLTEVDVTLSPDGSLVFRDRTGGVSVDLVANADGSGSLRDRTGSTQLDITVDADGLGVYDDRTNDVSGVFQTEVGILDPQLLIAGPMPVFGVADRFPPLDTLPSLSPPCATVIRLDADVLFDFDSAELRPEAGPLVDELAAVLTETGSPIEIHGHTDSVGDDAYNQDLAARRATSFETALRDRSPDIESTTQSFGESRPVAPNENADGSDNPAGRQLNRRIEVVIGER